MKSEYRIVHAIFVGLAERSDMLVVLDDVGVHRVASLRRLSPELRSDPCLLEKLKGLPWRPKQAEPDTNEIPLRISAEPVVVEENLLAPVKNRASEITKIQFYIRREHELRKYGLYPNCRGCEVARVNSPLSPPQSE